MVAQTEFSNNEIKSNLKSSSISPNLLDKIVNLIVSDRGYEEALNFSKNFLYVLLDTDEVEKVNTSACWCVACDGKVIVFPKGNETVIKEIKRIITTIQEIKSLNVEKCDSKQLDAFISYVISYSQASGTPYFLDLVKVASRCIDLYSLAFQWFCLGDFVNCTGITTRLKKSEFQRKNAYLSVLVKYYGLCINFVNPKHYFLRYSEFGAYSGEHLSIYRNGEIR